MPFTLVFTEEAESQLRTLEANKSKDVAFKAVRKALGLLALDPNYPSLNTHTYHALAKPSGEKVIESYAQNRTPGAYRIFWHYGPPGAHAETGLQQITIIAIMPHP
ncbi:MAG: hypothetical protein HY692_04710 [Cyanobacteria bacterium NC_groundwater_1444_Ag_S-0.65um_54_12]|nr:hypothetical protein [Cyanobacteria bacterium NC_groundwater_1444_Ag_S-0.65um_54_12]